MPRLPGRTAILQTPFFDLCEETDCPPGLPGCKRKKGAGAEGGAGEGEGGGGGGEGGGAAEEGEGEKGKAGPYSKIWVGVSFVFDFLSVSAVSNVCQRKPDGTAVNSQGYYCFDSSAGKEFPPDPATNLALRAGGTTSGGVVFGNIRALLTFDYALSPNFLAGARVGFVFGTYPGSTASHFAPVHLEARATYLFGRAPLSQGGFAPMGFAGLGASEYDAHQSTYVTFNNGMPQKIVDVWATNAPVFILLGGGVRYQFGRRVALLGALRLNLVVGGNGFLPTFGPELGGQYAF